LIERKVHAALELVFSFKEFHVSLVTHCSENDGSIPG
jgi:hypothetical protein